jgi:hypothetical protein
VTGDGGLVHWDDVEPRRLEAGHLAGSWRMLGSAAGSVRATVNRIQIDPGLEPLGYWDGEPEQPD